MEWNQHVLMILLTAVMLVSLLALCYAFTLYRSVRKEDAGNRTMQELSGFIHEGAMAFLKREYRIIIIFIIIVAAVLAVLGMVPSLQGIDGVGVSGAFCFVVGTLCSGAAGFIGMKAATAANARVAWLWLRLFIHRPVRPCRWRHLYESGRCRCRSGRQSGSGHPGG